MGRLEELLVEHRVLAVDTDGPPRSAVSRLVVAGRAVRAFPGVVMTPGVADDPMAWAAAVHLWDPSAVFLGRVALCLATGAVLPLATVEVNRPSRHARVGPVRFSRARLPGKLVEESSGWFHASVPAACLGLAVADDWSAVCDSLRRGLTTPGAIAAVAEELSGCHGADRRRRVLAEISGNPWSVAELDLHRLLRSAGLRGWNGNVRIETSGGPVVADVVFRRRRAVVEVNGFEYHGGRREFEATVARQGMLVRDGWVVVPVTPAMICGDPVGVLRLIRAALATARPARPTGLAPEPRSAA